MVSPASASTSRPSSVKVILVIVGLSALELDLDESILEGVGVDDVVVHARLAEVGDTLLQLGKALLALRRDELQPAIAHRHHHIVHPVHMLAGLGPRRKSVFGDAHALVVDLHRGCGFGEVADRAPQLSSRGLSPGSIAPQTPSPRGGTACWPGIPTTAVWNWLNFGSRGQAPG